MPQLEDTGLDQVVDKRMVPGCHLEEGDCNLEEAGCSLAAEELVPAASSSCASELGRAVVAAVGRRSQYQIYDNDSTGKKHSRGRTR